MGSDWGASLETGTGTLNLFSDMGSDWGVSPETGTGTLNLSLPYYTHDIDVPSPQRLVLGH